MWLIYYVKDGKKSWMLADTKEKLQEWADNNLDTSEMSGEDEYEIVDLARRDLQHKLTEVTSKLDAIKSIIK